jgi:DNA-binding CsgD family transcriptional regulator
VFRQAEALLAGGPLHTQAESALRQPTRRRLRLGQRRCGGRSSCSPSAAASAWSNRWRRPQHQRRPSSAAASLGLTQRELEVLVLVAEGQTNRQIGQILFITPKTAGVHVSRILTKLGVTGRGEAAASLTASASTGNDPRRPLLLFSAWQWMRLTECGQFGVITLAAPSRASRDSGCSLGRVDVSTRSNALYDRCATE